MINNSHNNNNTNLVEVIVADVETFVVDIVVADVAISVAVEATKTDLKEMCLTAHKGVAAIVMISDDLHIVGIFATTISYLVDRLTTVDRHVLG